MLLYQVFNRKQSSSKKYNMVLVFRCKKHYYVDWSKSEASGTQINSQFTQAKKYKIKGATKGQ